MDALRSSLRTVPAWWFSKCVSSQCNHTVQFSPAPHTNWISIWISRPVHLYSDALCMSLQGELTLVFRIFAAGLFSWTHCCSQLAHMLLHKPPTTSRVNFLLSSHTTSNSLLTQITPSYWDSGWVTTFEYHAPGVKRGISNRSSTGWMRTLSLWEKLPPMLFRIHTYLAGRRLSSAWWLPADTCSFTLLGALRALMWNSCCHCYMPLFGTDHCQNRELVSHALSVKGSAPKGS